MVITFEWNFAHHDVRPYNRHEGMAAASAELPAGAYTTFRTYHGNRVLRLAQHARRLEESAGLMGQHGRLDPNTARAAVAATLQAIHPEPWGAPERRFRLTFAPPQLFLTVEPFTPYPAALYESGVACASVGLHRDNPHAKSTGFIASAAQAYRQLPAHAHEGLMVANDGAILEGLSSNFFAVLAPSTQSSAPNLHTEEARVLMGVTRSLVLEVAAAVLPISTQAATLDALHKGAISEAFITSVSREILPVVKIDDTLIGDGRPGPITQQLIQQFAALVQRESEAL